VEDPLQLVRELRILDERLALYKDSSSPDSKGRASLFLKVPGAAVAQKSQFLSLAPGLAVRSRVLPDQSHAWSFSFPLLNCVDRNKQCQHTHGDHVLNILNYCARTVVRRQHHHHKLEI